MDMMGARYHSGLDQIHSLLLSCRAEKMQRCPSYIRSSDTICASLGRPTIGNYWLSAKPRLYCGLDFLSNSDKRKAWTKACGNFFGDDDDTLFEPTLENSLIFKRDDADDALAGTKFSWPLWLLGPFILLSTGVVPALWLPFVPLFEGSATAGLLALAGLDGIFNLGASMFLLMTDACARRLRRFLKKSNHLNHDIPSSYKVWTLFVNMAGLVGPLVAFVASKQGLLAPEPALLPISAMVLPYLALLLVHTIAELLVWRWQSPVWSILPLVYNCYSVLQLSRGLQLGTALGAPLWTIDAVKGLISWWVFVLGMQLMWIAWFMGSLQS